MNVLDSQKSPQSSHDNRLLTFVVVSLLLATPVQWAICRALHLGNPGNMLPDLRDFFELRQWTDSWLPMMTSLDAFRAHPEQPIYDARLYDTLIYPLTSELPLVFLRRFGLSDAAMLRVLAIASFAAVWATVGVLVAMAQALLRRRGGSLTWKSVVAVTLACLGCYPLMKGYSLGNAQTFLSFGFAVLVWLWTEHREREAGAVAAILAAVKPQFCLLLVWMLVRKRWGAVWAFCLCGAVLLTASIAVFGWANNVAYLSVLASLSHKAQSHYANQSMFGTLNRMIFNGDNLAYTPYVYTPYVPWVYGVTLTTSVMLVVGALVFPWKRLQGGTADLCVMAIVAVAASPMAWEHHYGIVPAIAAWIWFAHACWWRKRAWILAIAVFLCMNFLPSANLLATEVGWNVLQSYLYLGALLLAGWLMWLSRDSTPAMRT